MTVQYTLFVIFITLLSIKYGFGQTQSKIDENQMGMSVLYDMVKIFLGDVVHSTESTSYINLTAIIEDKDLSSIKDWKPVLKYLIGFSVCVAIGIVFIVVMPISGLIFCICRCCGRCGGKQKSNESKQSKCKRRAFCSVLLILNTVALAGVICAFVCNSLLYKSLQNDDGQGSIGHITGAFKGLERFINDSVSNGTKYVTFKFDETSRHILEKVNDTGTESVEGVLRELRAQALLDEAYDISREANETRNKLEDVGMLLKNLSTSGTELSNNLTDIKDQIESVCASGCSGFNAGQYQTQANFSSLGLLTEEAKKVEESLDMSTYISAAKNELERAKADAYNQVKKTSEEAADAITKVKKSIDDGMNQLITEKDKLLKYVPSYYDSLNDGDKYVRDYSRYAYYAGIGICCAYLLIVALYYIGILFGLCGERPGDDAPCCNTGTGSNFLMAGVGFTFIFSWILMIVCTVLFAVGGPVYTEGCQYFENHQPSKLKIFDDILVNGLKLKENIYTKGAPPNFSIANILEQCQRNEAIYKALQLDYLVDLDSITNITAFKKEIDKLKDLSLNIKDIEIINSELRNDLSNFTSALTTVNFNQYFEEIESDEFCQKIFPLVMSSEYFENEILKLEKNMTAALLPELARAVQGFADEEKQKANHSQTKIDILNNCAERLRVLDNSTLTPMKIKASNLSDTLHGLQTKTTLKTHIDDLIGNLTAAQNNFNANKTRLIKAKIADLGNAILTEISDNIDDVKKEIRENMAHCEPLSSAVYMLTDSVCVLALNPLNGMWFSFGWCLVFFVPCLIFAVLLTGQYRREHRYEKEFDDPNFLMYGGPSQDTIPLTSVDQTDRGHSSQSPRYPAGMSNAGYHHEHKRENLAPPPYDDRMHRAHRDDVNPPPKYRAHDLSTAYPPMEQRDGSRAKNYSYPY